MADTINAGDWIVVKLTQKVKLDDIITYKAKGEYITHRIVQVYKGTYITKGDANNAKDDEPIDQKQVVGKVVKILHSFGIFRKTLFNPGVLITLIITLFLFHIAFKKNDGKDKKIKLIKEKIIDVWGQKIILLLKKIIKKTVMLFNKIKRSLKALSHKKTKKEVVSKDTLEVKKEKKNNDEQVEEITKEEEISLPIVEDEHYKDEDELEKTSFYRVVPVDATEVSEEYKNAPTKEEVEEYYKDEDDLDKTSLYRIIPVDATEVNDTLLEIAQNEIKEPKQPDKEEKSEPVVEENEITTEESDALTQLNLELLKNIKGNRKSKNVIDTVMLIKREEINQIIDILIDDDKTYDNTATIKKKFIDTYIGAKYYNISLIIILNEVMKN